MWKRKRGTGTGAGDMIDAEFWGGRESADEEGDSNWKCIISLCISICVCAVTRAIARCIKIGIARAFCLAKRQSSLDPVS